MTHPSSCRAVSADVTESFLVISVGRAERNFLDRLIDDQSLRLILYDSQTVARYVKHRAHGPSSRVSKNLQSLLADLHTSRLEHLHTSQVLNVKSACSRTHSTLISLPLMRLARLGHVRVFPPAEAVPEAPSKPVHPFPRRPLALREAKTVSSMAGSPLEWLVGGRVVSHFSLVTSMFSRRAVPPPASSIQTQRAVGSFAIVPWCTIRDTDRCRPHSVTPVTFSVARVIAKRDDETNPLQDISDRLLSRISSNAVRTGLSIRQRLTFLSRFLFAARRRLWNPAGVFIIYQHVRFSDVTPPSKTGRVTEYVPTGLPDRTQTYRGTSSAQSYATSHVFAHTLSMASSRATPPCRDRVTGTPKTLKRNSVLRVWIGTLRSNFSSAHTAATE